MRAPKRRGAAVNSRRFNEWLASFSGYCHNVTRGGIELWLEQFSAADRDVAARVLDAVLFVGVGQIDHQLRELVRSLPGWDDDEEKRVDNWFFVPFSGSVGESGDSIMHRFRIATGMKLRRFNKWCIHRSDLLEKTKAGDTVVLFDDFSATGKQATDAWREVFAELLTAGQKVYLVLIAATDKALAEIDTETGMSAVCNTVLTDADNIFNNACRHFDEREKERILRYCRRAKRTAPKGFGEAGLLVVFAHGCPNNSIPILHAANDEWQGLFPRE